MAWVEAQFRGTRVLARSTRDGQYVAEGGRVEIRFRPLDGKAYRAASSNLTKVEGAFIFGDGACNVASTLEDAGGAEPDAPESTRAEATPVQPVSVEAASPRTRVAPSQAADPPATKANSRSPLAGGWVAYCDGACTGNPGPAGAGYLVIAPNGAVAEGYEYLGMGTNNIGELVGVLRALESIPPEATDVVIHTDSKYAIGVLSKGWKAKANQELVAKASALTKARRAKLVYVPGHAGIPNNERADELAREAVRTRSSRPIR